MTVRNEKLTSKNSSTPAVVSLDGMNVHGLEATLATTTATSSANRNPSVCRSTNTGIQAVPFPLSLYNFYNNPNHYNQYHQHQQQQNVQLHQSHMPHTFPTNKIPAKPNIRIGPSPLRQLLPIALCLLSFATVLSILIVHIDTTGKFLNNDLRVCTSI